MLIGLNGQLGSGKDSVYERTLAMYEAGGYGIPAKPQRISFADKLKISAAALLDIPREMLEGWKNDKNVRLVVERKDRPYRHIVEMDIRTLLQRYGTESHRDVFGDDFWVEQALAPVRHAMGFHTNTPGLFMVTDVRFPNEVEAIRNLGGQIWRVHGPDDNDGTAHASEQVLPDELVDVEINNTRRDDNFRSLDSTIARLFRPNGLRVITTAEEDYRPHGESLADRGIDPLSVWEKI